MAAVSDKLTFRIAGLVYHVPSEEKECGRFDGMLVPEPENPHDSHAIKVCKKDGTCVGYVPRNKTWYVEKMVRQKTPWWHCGKVILRMNTVQILECDLYHIENKVLDITPRRYSKVRKEEGESVGVDWFTGGLSLWNVFSFFDSIISSEPTITSVSSSPSSFLDWELFEAQIESDEYFDFGW